MARATWELDEQTGCWNWTGKTTPGGYGTVITAEGSNAPAHRYMYLVKHGRYGIPPGMHIDHLCRNRLCVNPAHLEPVTPSENQRRSPKAKLSEEKVQFIRENYRPYDREFGANGLARKFGCSHSLVTHVIDNTRWNDPEYERSVPGRGSKERTHCRNGHLLDSTRLPCHECRREATARHRARSREPQEVS